MKDNKLERFFNAINFDKNFTEYFNEASVKEVLLNKKINRMTLVIEIDELPPINVFKSLCEYAQNMKGEEASSKTNIESKRLQKKEKPRF